ncbi:MAG: hypothetical protein ACJAYN_000135 [Bermanella sp.]|jgi:hypothetical protein
MVIYLLQREWTRDDTRLLYQSGLDWHDKQSILEKAVITAIPLDGFFDVFFSSQ